MASKATYDNAVFFGDVFLADEILARLPAHCAVRCIVLSKRFRQLLVGTHLWLRQRRLCVPPALPYTAARLHRCNDGKDFYFHVVSRTFIMEHTVHLEHHSWYASTCNGLILVSSTSYPDEGQSSVHGVVFNPATKEEVNLSLQLPHPPAKVGMERRILGFGYGPSSKVYKALIREDDNDCTRLMVVSLDGSDGQEPRTVFSSDDDIDFVYSLHMEDSKLYFLIHAITFADEEGHEVYTLLSFDVDNEVVTNIAVPEGQGILLSLMEVHDRPCIIMKKDQDTMLWLLTTDNQWEHRSLGRVSSLKIEYKWAETLKYILSSAWSNMWDFQPTLISSATIFGDAASSS